MWESVFERWQEIAATMEAWYLEMLRAGGRVDFAQVGWPPVGAVLLIPVLAALVLLWFLVRGSRASGGADRASLARMTRRPRLIGYAAALLLLAGFCGWSLIAPLASAAIAPGVVSPDGNRKTIQHLEGGIIRAIHAREGDIVSAGQELVTLEDVQARARHTELRERYLYLLTTEARLIAEQMGASDVAFPPELLALNKTKVRQAMTGQQDLLDSRLATQRGREEILRQRVKQLGEENSGLREMIAGQETQLTLINEEIASVKELLDKGLERRPRLLALQRAAADIQVERAANRAQMARNQQQIGETEIQLLTMRQQDKERANEELTEVRGALAELRSELPLREDVLNRTVIKAPTSGTVMNLQVTTQSGVVGAGQPILDIVPAEATLIIDAQVKPIDIDTVQPGMRARVLLTAYRQRNLPRIHGSLRSISADRLIEDRSGDAYFLAKVEVDPAELAQLESVRLTPGMPAEVMILTGEQTLFEYLLRPLLDSVTKSFREG
jgi:HlyD family type I secretion membrane fusion protein